MRFWMRRLSTVNSFMRTMHSSGRPASTCRILKSPGQLDCFALVIWAISEWPELWLNSRELSTRAGRRLLAGESVKGKRTTTTSHLSQVTEGLFVLGGAPLVGHGGGKSAVPPGVKRLHLSDQDQPVLLELVDEHVPRLYPQTFPDFLRNGDLPFSSNLTGVHHYVLTCFHYNIKDSTLSLASVSDVACSSRTMPRSIPPFAHGQHPHLFGFSRYFSWVVMHRCAFCAWISIFCRLPPFWGFVKIERTKPFRDKSLAP